MHIKTMDAVTLKNQLDAGEVILVDVREPDEYHRMRIAGSVLIPLGQVSCNQLSLAKKRPFVIHCRSGQRSHAACERLLQEMPDLEVYNLEGGIMAWASLGYPVERGMKS